MVDGQSWCGKVERVVTKAAASATYESTFFAYAKNGQAVTHVVGEQWDDDGQTSCFPLHTHGYVNTYGWEYRYDGSRARYAARGLDPDRLYMVVNPLGGWSDYDGDEIYDDFYISASGPPTTTTRRFEPGIGRTDYTGSAYYHTDHLGTIRGMTNSSAAWIEPMAFTAFGERIVGTQDSYSRRYGYVGSFGYQASGEYPYLHLGERYYDPSTGRFLQRDPIGIRGGANVYGYVSGQPTISTDSTGLGNDWHFGELPPGWKPGGILSGPKPPPGTETGMTDEELAKIYVIISGGDESWMDNPASVKNVQWWLELPSWIVSVPAPWMKIPNWLRWTLWGTKGGSLLCK